MPSGRPWYETKTDREREQIIADRFAAMWSQVLGCELHPVKRKVVDGHEIDFDVVDQDGVVRLRVEAKYRDHRLGQFPTLFIGTGKMERAYELWESDDKPVFFAVAFKCGQFAYGDLCYPAEREVKYGGRRDRNDPRDEEMMLHIPLDQLRRF